MVDTPPGGARQRRGVLLALAAGVLALGAMLALPPRRRKGRGGTPPGEAAARADAGDPGGARPGGSRKRPSSTGGAPEGAPPQGLPGRFFLLVLALTIPFWILGGRPLPLPVRLPLSAVSFVNPLLAAAILTYRRDGLPGVRALLRRALDVRRVRNGAWYLPVLLFYPLLSLLSYKVMRLARLPLPADPQVAWSMAPVYLLAFFVAGAGEELGWTGYALDPMQRRWGALRAALALGVAWSLFHIVPDVQNGRPGAWILWHRLGTIAFRVLIVWVYNNAGRSAFAAILFHAMNNVSWALFPNDGSHYDPMVTTLLTLPAVACVVLAWDPGTLTRLRWRAWSRTTDRPEG